MGSEIRRVKREHGIDLFYAFWTIPSAFVCSFACGHTPFITGLMGSDDKVFGRGGITQPFTLYPKARLQSPIPFAESYTAPTVAPVVTNPRQEGK